VLAAITTKKQRFREEFALSRLLMSFPEQYGINWPNFLTHIQQENTGKSDSASQLSKIGGKNSLRR
jgi:hypothetical protein